jgi:NADPH2:quinone reductase
MGAGSGVGVAGMAIATHLGARVFAAATSQAKRDRAASLGAAATFNSTDPEFWKQVREATGGRGVEVVFEHIGPAVFKPALQCLAPGGTLVTCGATTGPEAALDLRYLFSRQLSVKVYPAAQAVAALTRLLSRDAYGKIVLTHSS